MVHQHGGTLYFIVNSMQPGKGHLSSYQNKTVLPMSHSIRHNVHQNAMLSLIPTFPTTHTKVKKKKKKNGKAKTKVKKIKQSRE